MRHGLCTGCKRSPQTTPYTCEGRGRPSTAEGREVGWLPSACKPPACTPGTSPTLLSKYCPLQDFAQLRKKRRFYARLLDNVGACGFAEPTPVQRQAIPLLMARREVMAVAPTGARPPCDKQASAHA